MNACLKIAIIKSNKSQLQISRETIIPEGRLSKIVNGWIQPSSLEQSRIADSLNESVTNIFPDFNDSSCFQKEEI